MWSQVTRSNNKAYSDHKIPFRFPSFNKFNSPLQKFNKTVSKSFFVVGDNYLDATLSLISAQYIQMTMIEVLNAIPINPEISRENSTFVLLGDADFTLRILNQVRKYFWSE